MTPAPALDPAALAAIARRLRVNILRMIANAGSGHPGGSLSAIDLVAYLYFHRMKIRPAEPNWDGRDRFVLSKGHCSPAIYAALAELGYFAESVLWTLRDIGSPLQGHPDMRKTPGVDMTTGSLGQGFSCAAGIALGGKLRRADFRVYAMLGDGEVQEGIVWEAAMAAVHYKLDNLIAIVDNNGCQTDGFTRDILDVEPLGDKWRGFGWEVSRIDGHDFAAIHGAFEAAQAREGRPHVIIADTVKGKGVREMENRPGWHGRPPSPEEAEAFVAEVLAGGAA
jgi:transketolase